MRNEGVGGRWNKRCHVLTGLVYRANCGHRMTAIPTVSRGKQYHRYLCSGYQQARVCMPYWFAADVLERAVIQRLKQHLRLGEHPARQLRPILVKAIQAQVGGPISSLDQAALRRERGKLERQVEQALTNLAVVPAEIAAQLGEKIKGRQAPVRRGDDPDLRALVGRGRRRGGGADRARVEPCGAAQPSLDPHAGDRLAAVESVGASARGGWTGG